MGKLTRDLRRMIAGLTLEPFEKRIEWALATVAVIFLTAYSVQVLAHPKGTGRPRSKSSYGSHGGSTSLTTLRDWALPPAVRDGSSVICSTLPSLYFRYCGRCDCYAWWFSSRRCRRPSVGRFAAEWSSTPPPAQFCSSTQAHWPFWTL